MPSLLGTGQWVGAQWRQGVSLCSPPVSVLSLQHGVEWGQGPTGPFPCWGIGNRMEIVQVLFQAPVTSDEQTFPSTCAHAYG